MTNPTLERAEQAAKREIDKLRKARVQEYPGSWKTHEGFGWENLNEVVVAATRAVLMAVLPTLERFDTDDCPGVYRAHNGDFVRYDDLEAILNDGEKPPLTD